MLKLKLKLEEQQVLELKLEEELELEEDLDLKLEEELELLLGGVCVLGLEGVLGAQPGGEGGDDPVARCCTGGAVLDGFLERRRGPSLDDLEDAADCVPAIAVGVAAIGAATVAGARVLLQARR